MSRVSLFLLIVFGMLMSCSQVPETQYFTLEYDLVTDQVTVTDLPVYIETFDANPLLAQNQMIYRTSEYEIKLDHYRRWVMAPNDLVQQKLNDYFHESDLFSHVVHQVPRDRRCFYLSGHLQDFAEIAYGPKRQAHIAVWFELINMQTRETLMSAPFEQHEPIVGGDADAIAAAMSRATLALFTQLAETLHEHFQTQ